MFTKTNYLKAVRLQRGMALAEIAARGRIGTATLTAVERYGHEPRLDTKERIATALGVEVQAIWTSADQPDAPTAA